MSRLIGIIGDSGTGKSHSIQTLDPKETFLINVNDKDLPFRGWLQQYKPVQPKEGIGNYLATDNVQSIMRCLQDVSDNRPDITSIVLDDNQYIMANEFMRRAKEKGYDRFSDIAQNMFNVLTTARQLRRDLDVFILSHDDTERDQFGNVTYRKIKTIGKMTDQYIKLEGLFTVLLFTETKHDTKENKTRYYFLTNSDDKGLAKSPEGMFDSLLIPNDLKLVKEKINEYYNG